MKRVWSAVVLMVLMSGSGYADWTTDMGEGKRLFIQSFICRAVAGEYQELDSRPSTYFQHRMFKDDDLKASFIVLEHKAVGDSIVQNVLLKLYPHAEDFQKFQIEMFTGFSACLYEDLRGITPENFTKYAGGGVKKTRYCKNLWRKIMEYAGKEKYSYEEYQRIHNKKP